MHDGIALVSFLATVAIGIYSLFLRSQIASQREAEKSVGVLNTTAAVQSASLGESAGRVERIERETSSRFERLEQRLDAVENIAVEGKSVAERAASREAVQGIRGDIKALSAKLDAMPSASVITSTLAEVGANLKALTATVVALDRRTDRHDDFLHSLNKGAGK